MFFLSHLIYSFSVIYGNTQSLFYELFYELILNPKLEFFNKNKAALLYICETGDGMQKMRSRLFQYWFSIYNEREEYLFPPQIVYDEEENENYAALIIRKDNPCFVELVSEFTDTINLLNGKPE